MNKAKGFLQYGGEGTDLDDGAYEDFLVGDRVGLESLRLNIDEVLSGKGEVVFECKSLSLAFVGIKLASRVKGVLEDENSDGLSDFVGVFFVWGFILTLVMGLWKIGEVVLGLLN